MKEGRKWIETKHLDPVPLCNRQAALVLVAVVLLPWIGFGLYRWLV